MTTKLPLHRLSLNKLTLALLLAPALATPAFADSVGDALAGGKASLDARLRYEQVDQANALKTADAYTLRIRAGYASAAWEGFSLSFDLENNRALGGEDYNSLVNGKTTYSVVADPEATELNQAFLQYANDKGFSAKFGRQRLAYDNQRFIGNVGWRQNEQTFDALSVTYAPSKELTLNVANITTANRVFSEKHPQGDFDMSSPLVNLKYKVGSAGDLVGYAYFLDFEKLVSNSTRTLGVRWLGKVALAGENSLGYTLEMAKQDDYGKNPASFSHDYRNLDVSYNVGAFSFIAAHETLGGNGSHALQTPLATLHIFNGWADQFLVTPNGGLVDTRLQMNWKYASGVVTVMHNDYESDAGSVAYGSEFGVSATYNIGKRYTLGAKIAQYDADKFSVDADKLWVWGEVRF